MMLSLRVKEPFVEVLDQLAMELGLNRGQLLRLLLREGIRSVDLAENLSIRNKRIAARIARHQAEAVARLDDLGDDAIRPRPGVTDARGPAGAKRDLSGQLSLKLD